MSLFIYFSICEIYSTLSIEELSDSRLSAKLRELPEANLELLTLLCVDGLSQAQTARVLGCTQQAVSKRLRKIKKHLA